MNERKPKYKILELGPGNLPLHQRGEFELNEGEDYTAIDKYSEGFKTEVWRIIKETYGDRVHLIGGDALDIPEPEDGIFYDEIVANGTIRSERIFEQASNLLKPGGKLKIGFTWTEIGGNAADYLDEWNPIARKHGFKHDKKLTQIHDYSKVRGKVSEKYKEGIQYITIIFVKQ